MLHVFRTENAEFTKAGNRDSYFSVNSVFSVRKLIHILRKLMKNMLQAPLFFLKRNYRKVLLHRKIE